MKEFLYPKTITLVFFAYSRHKIWRFQSNNLKFMHPLFPSTILRFYKLTRNHFKKIYANFIGWGTIGFYFIIRKSNIFLYFCKLLEGSCLHKLMHNSHFFVKFLRFHRNLNNPVLDYKCRLRQEAFTTTKEYIC